jgi:predicted nicotinamide N-methyase
LPPKRSDVLWDHDAKLNRLDARYRAVRERDVLGAGQAPAAVSAVAAYRAALEQYATRVYATDISS